MKPDVPRVANLLTQLVQGMCFEPCKVVLKHPTAVYAYPRLIILPHRADFSIVCGTAGRQIKSLQYIGNMAGIQVLLEESDVGARGTAPKFKADPDFDIDLPTRLLTELLWELTGTGRSFLLRDLIDSVDGGTRLQFRLDPSIDSGLVFALADVFTAWGFRQGQIIKVLPPKHQPQTV